ncbi:MAG: VWA-like domain-containing protein [Pseudomonadota bacterium]
MNPDDRLPPDKKVQRARTMLILNAPFFGRLNLRVKAHPDPTCEKAWIDGLTVGYNPEWVKGCTVDQLMGVFAKLIMHPACGHHVRRESRTPKRWQKACDQAIIPLVLEAGFELPGGFAPDTAFTNMAAERIYSMLPEDEDEGGQGQGPQPGQGGQKGQGGGQSQGGGQPDNGPCGDVRDLPPDADSQTGTGASQGAKEKSENDWRQALLNASKSGKGCGDAIGTVKFIIDEMLKAKVTWREQLRMWIIDQVSNDYSMARPDPRYIYHGVYMPSLTGGVELLNARGYVDASGSVKKEELQQFGAELSSILEEFPQVELVVNYFDTVVRVDDEQRFRNDDLPIVLEGTARGGTKFVPVFEHVANCGEQPRFLLIFSDMECWDFPEAPPDYPVLWVNTGKVAQPEVPFGEVIDLDIDEGSGY